MELHHQATRRALVALASVVVLLLAGCGSGGSKTYTAAVGSPVQFQATADSLCARINYAIDAVKPANASLVEIVRHVPRNVAIEREGITALSKMKPPANLASAWQQILHYRHTLANELTALVSAAKKNDTTGINALTISKQKVHRSLKAVAEQLGLKDCGLVG